MIAKGTRIGYKVKHDEIMHKYKGRNQVCYAVPKSYWDMMRRNSNKDYNKIVNLQAQVRYYKQSMKIKIDKKIREADLLINRLKA